MLKETKFTSKINTIKYWQQIFIHIICLFCHKICIYSSAIKLTKNVKIDEDASQKQEALGT